MDRHIDLMEAWDDSDMGIGMLTAYTYHDQFEALVDKHQEKWDEWVEAENPDEDEQQSELPSTLKALNWEINEMYLDEWAKQYSRDQMLVFVDMLTEMNRWARITIANESFLVDDLMQAWNRAHPDDTPVYIVGAEK